MILKINSNYVSDDKSTDQSLEIAKTYNQYIPNLVILEILKLWWRFGSKE